MRHSTTRSGALAGSLTRTLTLAAGAMAVAAAVWLVAGGCGSDKKTNPEPTGTWEVVGTEGISSGEADLISVYLDGDTPYVAFTDEAVDNVVVKRFDGSAWVKVGDDVSSGPSAYLGSLTVSGGVPFVAYGLITALVKKYEGGQWMDVGGPVSSGHASELKMFISEGIPYVAYRDDDHDYRITVRKFVDPDWVTVGTANFSDGQVDLISLAVDGGTPYVAFRDLSTFATPGHYYTTVMKYDGAWTVLGTPRVLSGEPGRWGIAVDAGVPYVVYSNIEGGPGKVNVVKFVSGTWHSVGQVDFSDGGAWYCSLDFDGGVPYVAFQDEANGGKATVMKLTGGVWTAVGPPHFTASQVQYTSLQVSGGIPYLAFKDMATTKVTVMRWVPED